jgi:hypothetical protein
MGVFDEILNNSFIARVRSKWAGQAQRPAKALVDQEPSAASNKRLDHFGCRTCDAYVTDGPQWHWCNDEPDHYRNILEMGRCPRRTCLYCATLAGCKRARELSQRACMKFERMAKATDPITVIELGPTPRRQSA